MDSTQENTQVMCRFVTRMSEQFRITPTPIAVPAKLTRYGLSEVVNHLLNLDTPRPFDFIVEGQLLRGTLEKLLVAGQISAETVTQLEYIPAVSPPAPQAKGEHNDWVSSVDGAHAKFIVTGCYDGVARVWTPQGKCVSELAGHSDAVTSVAVVPGETLRVVTASKDCTAVLWEAADAGGKARAPAARVVFQGLHRDSVEAATTSPDGGSVCTASADGTAGIWTWDREEAARPAGKKQRTGPGSDGGAVGTAQAVRGETRRVLARHTEAVAAVCWPAETSIFTASWDRAVHKWDAEAGAVIQTFTAPKAVHSLSAGLEGSLLALAGADKAVRIWDPRQKESAAAAVVLTSHASWVSCVRWAPTNPHHLWSAGHDTTVKLWDIRAKVPLHTVNVHTDKALAVDVHSKDFVVSGGADSKMHIYKIDAGSLE